MPKFRKLSAAELDGPHLPSAAPFPTGEGEKAVHVPGTSAQPHAPQSAAEIGATTYPRYPAYKDSGVEWLGEVPNHWLTKRFKYLFQLSDERNGTEPVGEMLSVSGYRGVIPKIYEDDNQKRTLEDLAEYRVVHKGQLAINIMWLNYTGLGVSEYEGYVSPAYRVYNIDTSLDKKFLHHLLRSSGYVAGYTKYLQGIRPNSLQVSTENLESFCILIPPLPEQRAIAAFLDGETARIDALVAKQEALIALLQEKRKAVISHAVTKGLNADAPMKDSGVAWLGEVPAEWRTATLKHLVSIPITDGPHETPIFLDEGVPFLSAEAVKNGKLDFNLKRGYISSELHNLYTKKCQPMLDDIFMVKSGNTTGNIAIVETDEIFAIWSPLALIRCNSTMILPRYLYLFMQSQFFQTNVNLSASYGTQPNIGMGVIENLPVTYPATLTEQQEIVEQLSDRLIEINTLIAKAEQFIERLREHRTALIAAAVTGKIDVRAVGEGVKGRGDKMTR